MQSDRPAIFLVDDEHDILEVLSRGLTRAGFEVHSFADPVDALANYRPNFYAGILLDIRMPRMSGLELGRKIWERDPNARICFLTAFEVFREEAKRVFPNVASLCFIKKPISTSDLLLHLEKHGIMARIE